MSISAQQLPYLPMPMLLSSSRGFALQSTQLASPLKLDVVRALCVAIPRPVLGARLVVAEALPALLVHLDEVHRTIHATEEVGDVDVQCELAVLQLPHEVLVVVVQNVEPRANIH